MKGWQTFGIGWFSTTPFVPGRWYPYQSSTPADDGLAAGVSPMMMGTTGIYNRIENEILRGYAQMIPVLPQVPRMVFLHHKSQF